MPSRTNPNPMENSMKNKTRERRLQSFEALQIALATEDAKRMTTTPEMERQVEALYAAGRSRMAQLRYAENDRWPVTIMSPTIRPEVLETTREEALAWIASVHAAHPGLQSFCRDFETLSDHDLHSMLEDALRLTADKV